MTDHPPPLVVAAAQIAPVYFDREATLGKVCEWIERAHARGARLVCFGESLCPGYPGWLDRTGGASFDDAEQKGWFERYSNAAVTIERGHLDPVCAVAAKLGVFVVLGVTERPLDRSGHTLYCSAVVIDDHGKVASVHRKLVPTYEERLVWGIGDGHGLVVHEIDGFTLGVLNCWENWLPLARAALHGQGCDLHVAIWPGATRLTEDITRFVALEGRSYAISASGLLRASDLPADLPRRDQWVRREDELFYDGGSAIAAPDGTWLAEPVTADETLVIAECHPHRVREARQNLDISGHYSRPDVLSLQVDGTRQSTVRHSEPTTD